MHRVVIVAAASEHRATRDALALGVALARPRGAEILLTHIHVGAAEPVPRIKELAESAPHDVPTHPLAVPAPSIVAGLHRVIAERGAEMLVVGPTHLGTLARAIRRDVALDAISDGSCVVACAPEGYSGETHPEPRRIGVAWDAGDEAAEALEWAVQLAERTGGEIEIISVLGDRDDEAAARPRLEALCHAVVERVPAKLDIRHGDPASALGRGAELDMLVLGSRGQGALDRLLHGSVSGKVVHKSTCPVVVVPHGVHAAAEPAGV